MSAPVKTVVVSNAARRSSMMAADIGPAPLRRAGVTTDCYAAVTLASWIARQIFSGVNGMLMCLMPYSESASTTALTTQTRLPAQPASPQPLVPSGLDLAGEG